MIKGLRIGDLAATSGLNRQTIRYYERVGLLPRPSRSAAGYRLYSDGDRERLAFIRRAKGVGLSLAQIRDLVVIADSDGCGKLRPRLRQVLTDRLREIEERMRALDALKADLERTLVTVESTCRPVRGDACGCLPAERLVQIERGGGRLARQRRR